MKPAKPKLVPTLFCLTLVGLFAATIPLPGGQSGISLPQDQPTK